jgi:hypothetical protein
LSFTYKRRNGKDYLYFQAGSEGTYYISPKSDPSKVNVKNVKKSLHYILTRIDKDREIMKRLLSFLPEEERFRIKPGDSL